MDVINPATEEVCGHISAGSAADVDKAVAAAQKAFATYSQTSREERIELLQRILAEYQKRFGDIANAITEEMGAPASLAQRAQAADRHAAHLDRHRGAEELQVRGRPRPDPHRQGADRRLRPDHALELADQPDRLQGRARRSPPAAPWC